jgi:protein TonB
VKSADFVSYPRGITFRSREDVSLAAGSSVPRRVLLENRRHYYGITLIGDLSFPSVWLNQRVDMRSSALFPFVVVTRVVPGCWARLCSARSGAVQSGLCRGDEKDSPDCITPPLATYSPEPEYPKKEGKAGREGEVILRLVVGTDGATHDITVARSLSPEFDAAAMEVVKTWRFSPATKNGKPISLRMDVQVGFHLKP